MKLLLLTFCFFNVSAQTDEEYLNEWTIKNEAQLIKKNHIIESIWFENTCLDLAQQLKFTQIKQCKLIQSHELNAFVFKNGHVYFTTSMLKEFSNKHQWAIVLAHENAHVVLNHYLKMLNKIKNPGVFFPKRRIKKMLLKHEQEADSFAKNIVSLHGFDYEQIYFFLKQVEKKTEKQKHSTHTKLSLRIKNAKKSEFIDEKLIKNINRTIDF